MAQLILRAPVLALLAVGCQAQVPLDIDARDGYYLHFGADGVPVEGEWSRGGLTRAATGLRVDGRAALAFYGLKQIQRLNPPHDEDMQASPVRLARDCEIALPRAIAAFVVEDGVVSFPVEAMWGAVLVETSHADPPAPVEAAVAYLGPTGVRVQWPIVRRDTAGGPELAVRYDLHRVRGSAADDGFEPNPANRIATLPPPAFGAPGGRVRFDDSDGKDDSVYRIRAFNAAGIASQSRLIVPEDPPPVDAGSPDASPPAPDSGPARDNRDVGASVRGTDASVRSGGGGASACHGSPAVSGAPAPWLGLLGLLALGALGHRLGRRRAHARLGDASSRRPPRGET